MRRFAFLFAFLLGVSSIGAQPSVPVVTAHFDRDSLLIGDQVTLDVQVAGDVMQMIDFPTFDSNRVAGLIEVLEESPVDTLRDGRRQTLSKQYRMTVFDEGIYNLGPFPVLYIDKNIVDTLYSRDSLRLKVITFEIDTATQTIFDVKVPLKLPLRFGEVSGWILLGLVVCAALGLLIWAIVRRRKNKPIFGKPKPALPPHVVAIRELENLHNQKVWQNNKHKLYYTRLTDILRVYLCGRYGISAMEMTSEEILDALRTIDLPEKSRTDLSSLLHTADFVKFAKHIPSPEENEQSYFRAYYFVEETKEVPEENMPEAEAKEAAGKEVRS